MHEPTFRLFLKRAGKQAHVIDELVEQVQHFQAYLAAAGSGALEAAAEQDLLDYAAGMSDREIKIRMRAIALCYKFLGNTALSRLAHELREQQTAKTRQAFRLRDFLGADAQHIARLEAAGIATTGQMLEAGNAPAARQQLAAATGIAPAVILELVKLADLSRIQGVKGVRARLYYAAGLDTLDAFAGWELETLRQMLVEFVERTGFEGIPPLPKELRFTIDAARELPRLVEY